jgi:hypothetical protein
MPRLREVAGIAALTLIVSSAAGQQPALCRRLTTEGYNLEPVWYPNGDLLTFGRDPSTSF